MTPVTDGETLADLRAENLRLQAELDGDDVSHTSGSHTGLFVGAVIGLSALLVLATIAVFAIRPDKDNTTILSGLGLILVPLITAFLGAALREVHLGMNSRLSQVVLLTRRSARLEGQLTERTARLADAAKDTSGTP